MFRKGTRKDRKQVRKQRETRRRRLSTLVSRKSQLEALEQRNLLAAYVVDVATDDAADISGVIDGDLSLREAIIAANTNAAFGDALAPGAADGDSITFAGALAGATITLGNGQIFIGDDVAIDGSAGGASRITIDAAALSRVVDIFSSGSPGIIDDVDLANLILTNGDATGSTGGGIRAQLSPVALTNVDVTDSTAGDVGGVESDGGSMTIIGGTVSGNTTLGSVGGISGIGGTTLNINGTTIEDNSAGFQGGGVFNFLGSTATIDGATISDNTASGPGGGGIYNSGSLDVINGTVIVDNVADGVTGSGGGILNDSGGTLNVDNSLILSNDAERAGGGIEDASGAGTPVTLTNVALDGNNAFGTDPTAPGNGGGLHVTGDGNVDIDGGSVSGNFAAGEGGGLWNSTGTMTLTSASAQLVISVNTASGDFQAVSSVDLQGGGGIFNNGGDLIIDGSGIGIGVENNLADGLTSPTTTAGSGGGIMSIGGNVTINEVFIFQNEAVRAGGGIEVIVGTVDITNSTIDSNDVSTDGLITSAQPGNGGGLHITSGATVTIDGGGITGNTAQAEGGGLWNSAVGTLNITSTSGAVTIENNEARGNADGSVFPVDLQGGGGIFNNGDGINPGGRLDIDGSANGVSISNNTASGLSTGPGTTAGSGGGILSIDGLVTINDARIGSNEAIRAGGGIEIVDGALRINDSEIDNNDVSTGGAIPISTPGNGGGIHVTGPALVELSDTMVNANAAGNEGGGLWNSDTGSMTIDGGQIVGNTASGNAADDGGGGIFNNGGLLGIGFTASVDITNNVADGTLGSGGGIFNNVGGSLFLGTGLVNISGNTAERAGGGIEHVSALTLNLNDITLNDNAAQGAPGNGGGLHISGAAVVNIIGGTVNGNSAAEEGGGLWNGGGTMTINGTTISGNTASGDAADQGGGGVFSAGGDLVIGNVSAVDITNNVANGAAGSGGGILNDGGNTEVTGGNITGNSAIRAGGGIEITGASLFLGGVNLSNNTAVGGGAGAPGNGGGLHVSGAGDVDIDASTVNGNSAALEGGGLWNGGGTMTIDGTTIDGNTASGPAADDGGGGIFNQAGVLEIGLMTPSNVTNNVADGALGSGGGIFLNSSSSMVMNGGVIVGNVANRAGGGIEDASDTGLGVTLNNVILEINRAIGGGVPGSPGNGGGIHVSGNSDVSITDGIILGNSAALEGGGLWNGSGTMTVLRTPIVVNTASGPVADDGGGGIFNSGGTVDLDDLVIDGNVADGAAGSGGGILNLGGSITINSVLITANTANRAGGGIEDRDGTGIDITDSVIRFNDAGTNPGNGGGIHITGTGTVNLDGTTVHNNTAVEGGGLWNSGGGTFNLINSTISTNAATGSDGGGIFNTSGGTVITDSVTVTLNSASTGVGSGIAGGTSGVTLENTIVAQNPGGGTEQNLSGGTGAINSADFNLIGDPDDGTLTGLTVNTIFGGDALLLPLMNNGGPAPPVLVTHLPGAGSPAIGFGSTTQTDDQRDALRPQGSQDDIGAIEVDLNGFVITANDAPLFGQAGDGNPDEFLIINDPIGLSGDVLVFVNSRLLTQTFPKATTGLIVIRGSADDDTVIIDNSNGLIGTRIVFDGDGTSGSGQGGEFPVPGGFDVLRLVGDTPVNTTYNPGETADAGAVFQENNQIVQKVEFFGLEPIQVLAPAGGNNILNLASAPLGVGFPQALNGQNTINYVEGPNSNDPADVVFAGALTGLLTVDGFESLEFANFEVLNIDAGPGSDEINLNNPVTPDELGVINVDGDDPTASDTLIANSVPGIVDSLTLQPSAQGVGTITGAGPDINYVGIEDIELVVQSADGDGLDIDGTAGNDAIEHTPLANGFSGVFTGALDLNNATGVGPFSMPRTTYHNVDQNTGIGVNENVPGGEDTVVYHGTSSNDQFTLNGELLTQESNGVTFLFAGSGTDTTTTQVVLVGENGDDVFNIMSNDNAAVDVQGGNPSGGSDVLNFTGSGVGAVTLDLEAKTVQEAGFGAVSYAGVETVNIEANEALTVNGGDADDTINVTPTGAGQDGTFDHNHSPGVIFNYTLADSAFFNGALGENQLNILGSVDADTITSAPNVVTVNGSSVTIGGGFDSTQVLGLLGNDDIDLSNLTTASPITIRGGDGDDTITGTPQNDLIFGGSGNDVLVGAGANDTIYGEAGNDTIGGAAAGSDDPGNDFFFGGDGSDLFIWEPGDAQDTISGGDDGNDIFEFRGRGTAGDTMTLAADGAGVDAIFNAATINVAGVEDIVVAPGDGGAADVTIEDLFGTEVTTVDVDLPAAGSGDAVDVDGRNGADNIDVAINGAEVVVNGLTYDVSVSAGVAGEDRLTINGRGGDDSIKVAAGVEAAIDITLNGGDGDDFLSADAIINGGAGNDILIGGAGNDTINGNAGDDLIDGRGGVNTVDGGAGEDTILVTGTAAGETLGVTHTAGTVTVAGGPSAGTQNISNMERVAVNAGDGADTINITTLAAGGLNYDVLGGNPIGAVGDTLNLTSPTGVTFMAGPESDSGALVDNDGAIISYDEIEDVSVTIAPAGPVVIMGTGADDDITAAGVGANSVDVTVNNGPTITYVGVTTLTLQGKEGDDDITIDVNNAINVAFIVDGGLPTTGSDDLRITGDDTINDNPTWTPDAVDGGDFALDSLAVAIDVTGIENLFYDGEADNETLTVVGTAGDDRFVHTPADDDDAGNMQIDSLLGVNYVNLGAAGSLVADGGGQATADVLGMLGTPDGDQTVVAATTGAVTMSGVYGDRIAVAPNDIEVLQIDGRDGNDLTNVATPLPYAAVANVGEAISITDEAGADDIFNITPGVTPVLSPALPLPPNIENLGTVTVNGVPIVYLGSLNVVVAASDDAGDALTINDDGGDNNWLVTSGGTGDAVQIDNRESIDYNGFSSVDLTNGAGTDNFTIHPTSLSGFNSSLTVNGDAAVADDTVTLIGTEAVDTVTSTATAVTVNGVEITVGNTNFAQLTVSTLGGDDTVDLDLNLASVHKVVDLGEGDDSLDASGMQDGDFFGGIGNDTIVGSPLADRIFGGPGNDILIGGAGSDFQYGGDGNDIFGNPTLVADGVADDPGTDFNFGGNGFDNFVWEPGDGTDFNNGGDDAADVFRFFARNDGAASTFDLRSGGTPTHFNAVFNGTVIDNHGIEDVIVDPLDGNDTVNVNDLFATEVVNVTIIAGGGDESITVEGRNVADDIDITVAGTTVRLEGLSYDVLINSPAAGGDRLTVSGNDGDDFIKAQPGVEAIIDITLNGDNDNDTLSADAIINGGAGDDFLIGGAGNDTINGNDGEDTMIGGAGNDVFDGGLGFDTILIQGTSGQDVINVFQALPTTLIHTVNGNTESDTLLLAAGNRTVEQALVVAGDGADLIRVNWLDAHGVNANTDSLRMTVEGGSDATSDRLVVVDDGTDDLVLYRKGQADNSGTVQVGPGNAEPLLNVFSDVENIDFVDENGNAIVNAPAGPQLVVFKHDPFESNDDRFTATYLGSGDTINVDPTIDPGPLTNPFGDGQDLAGDSDFYRVVAETTGTLDFQVYFRQVPDLLSGRPGLPNDGNLDIFVRDAAGNVIANFGVNDADDDERVRIPAVEGQTYFLEVFGDNGDAINIYNFTVVNHAPPVPYALELWDNPPDGTTNPPGTSNNSDTGRSQFDNHTYDNTPTLFFRLDDGIFLHDLPGNPAPDTPPDEVIDIPFREGIVQPNLPGFAIAIFDEGNTLPQTGTPPQTPLGFATSTAQDGVYTFTVPVALALSEGSHFLSARVQMLDPANPLQTGFGERSLSLEIVVDETPPPVAFGLATVVGDGLHPDSDSGDPVIPATLVDRITNDETPTFFGRAEANSIVRLYVDMDNTDTLTAADLLIGQTVANPLDGTEQLETPANPLEPGGQWEITSTVNMNDPRILAALGQPKDGLRTILLSAEDLAGNITAPDQNVTLEIFVDTQGPQVTDVFITGIPTSVFNLFTLKPETPQPTPRVDSLTISVRDLPNRVAQFLYAAISNGPPAPLDPIVLVGDHNGAIPIAGLAFNSDPLVPGSPATGEIVLNFDEPLPDDRFTLTLSDNLIDPVGNKLDGESNAAEPIGIPDFQQPGRTTGDGIPGGEFIARFTVDSRPEVATWSQGVVYADINGNFVWDPEGQDNDFTNRDFVMNFGEVTDAYFAGNFATAGAATASGFDKLGAYGAVNGQYQFFLDTNDDGVGDTVGLMAFQVNAIPVAGNFSGGHPGDEIGAFDGRNWYLDTNGNNHIDAGEQLASDLRGIPLVGDFNGDGDDDLATYNNDTGIFQFDLDRDGDVDDTLQFGFAGFGDRPVAGDMNLDGIDDIVMWVTDQNAQLPKESGEFHFLVSDRTAALPSNVFDPFSPAPLGNDLISQFGDEFALPLIGNFDPPINDDGNGSVFVGSLSNELNPLDTTVDGIVSARDALVVINALARENLNVDSSPLRVVASLGGFKLDATQDGDITARDALVVINGLAQIDPVAEEAEQSNWAASADSAIADIEEEDDDLLALLALDQESSRVKS